MRLVEDLIAYGTSYSASRLTKIGIFAGQTSDVCGYLVDCQSITALDGTGFHKKDPGPCIRAHRRWDPAQFRWKEINAASQEQNRRHNRWQ